MVDQGQEVFAIQLAQITTVNMQNIMNKRKLTKAETIVYEEALKVLHAYFVINEYILVKVMEQEGIDYGI